MAPAAEATWPAILAQTVRDLGPFPGRFALAWRMAALCALVTGAAMLYRIPEAAISCYLVIFLMRPDASETIGQAVGLIVLVTVIVALMIPLVNVTVDAAFLRMVVMAGATFVGMYLASATTLGETGAIIGLVIAFVLSLIGGVPAGILATEGLKYAWEMVAMPMVLMVAFLLVLGRGPHSIVAEAVARRLAAAADALEDGDDADLVERLHEGNADLLKRVGVARLLHLAPNRRTLWLAGAVETSYRLLLAAAALPADAGAARQRLTAACRTAHEAVAAGRIPQAPEPAEPPASPAEEEAWQMLASLAAADGGARPRPDKPPFFLADAFSNPDHQRYALKTTAAAMICYLIYTGISWQGIHTAMITCYVAALGTTGETVHKLVLRILGCLVGAALGVGAIILVIPHLTSVGGLMALVFVCVLVGAWVAAGNERVAYAGVQIGLAFLLTVLNGFAPSTDMSNAGDRIAGILLGNVIIYLIFTGIWPRSAIVAARASLADALAALSRVAAAPPSSRPAAVPDAATAAVALGKAREVLFMLPFEPRREQPPRAEVARLAALIDATDALVPTLAISRQDLGETSQALARNAAAMRSAPAAPAHAVDDAASHGMVDAGQGMVAAPPNDPPMSAQIAGPMARIQNLAGR